MDSTELQQTGILQKQNDLRKESNKSQSDLEKKSDEIEKTHQTIGNTVEEGYKTDNTVDVKASNKLKNYSSDDTPAQIFAQRKKSDKIKKTHQTIGNTVEEGSKTDNTVDVKASNKLKNYSSDDTPAQIFAQRKKDVRTMSYIWLALGGVASVALVGIIYWLFASSNIDYQNLWADIVIKSIKTFPVVCMAIYFFKEYAKERSLTEEYAFREIVASTMKANLDQFEEVKDEKKCTLLQNTIEKLYTKPSFSTKDGVEIKLNSKDIVDIADKFQSKPLANPVC